MDIIVSKLAYCKILLHLAKYPHLACNGVLLSKKQTNNSQIEYVDAIPLFHSGLSLSSNIEIALWQIDAFCEQNDLEISGYYHANENSHDNQPNIICHKIAEKLKEVCTNTQSHVFFINNEKINPKNEKPMYRVLSLNGDFKLIDAKLGKNQIEKGTYDLCLQLLKLKAYNDLNDFDNHLDNINKDWLNVKLNDIIINSKQELLG